MTRGRAILCLLLNVIVFPGLGTLMSGERERRKTGFVQAGLGAVLLAGLVLVGMGSALFGGVSPETVKTWLGNLMMVLVLWNLMTGIQLFRASSRNRSPRAEA